MAAAHALCLMNDPACYDVYYEVYTGERKNNSGMIAQEMQILHNPEAVGANGISEVIGYPVRRHSMGSPADDYEVRKSGTAARAALIAALATDPEAAYG